MRRRAGDGTDGCGRMSAMATTPPDRGSRLYDLVAAGLAGYAHARFRVRVLGAPLRLDERTLLVSSHRSDSDVPLIVAALYRQAHGLLRRGGRIHFAVRDDLFIPGFLAGYPPRVPRPLRRLLFGLDIGPVLRRGLPCHPIRSATTMHLVELLREHPDEPLAELVPDGLRTPIERRAAALGRPAVRARDVLDGDFADLLWVKASPDDLVGPAAEESWRARGAAATEEFRGLVEVLCAGRPLLLFPEGRPSPDGELGPLQGGVAALVRRAEPTSLVPLSPAYDPLAGRRPHAYLGVGAAVEPPVDTEAVLELLRRTTPLTVGESLAAALADGDDPVRRLAADVAAAEAEGRPYERELADAAVRAERLAAARARVDGRELERLNRAYRSARA
jgi:1-acyl-sn-glycerol-3-phosphate acyltransferase